MNISIGLDNEIDNVDTYKAEKSSSCYFCGMSACVSGVHIHSKKIIVNTCTLCCTISKFNKLYINWVMLCHSNLSQLDIIKLTHEYYKKHHRIPKPNEIDDTAIMIKLDCLTYAQFYDQLDPTVQEQFKQFVFFFTSEMQVSGTKNLFKQNVRKDIPYDMSFFDLPTYKLSDTETLLINEFTSKCKKQCISEMDVLKSLLEKELTNVKTKIKDKDTFLKTILD